MTLHRVLVPLLILAGISFAQDTNFPVGPQYLVTGNPMLLQPIATPSLSLSGETFAGTSEVPRPVEIPAFAPIETVVYLDNVYWGEHDQAEVVARRMEPPSMTPDQTQWYMNAVASQALPEAQQSTETAAFIGPNVIELTGGPLPTNLPPSLTDVGVTGMTDSQSLLQRGYGLSLGEVAAYWKAHKRQAPRVFTNENLHRR
jgi:hypothetical protein